MKNKLDHELLNQIENGEFKSVWNIIEVNEKLKVYAENTFKKDKRIITRINKRDLVSLLKKGSFGSYSLSNHNLERTS